MKRRLQQFFLEDPGFVIFVFTAERLVNVFLYKSKSVFNVPLPVAVAVSPKVKIFPALGPELFA